MLSFLLRLICSLGLFISISNANNGPQALYARLQSQILYLSDSGGINYEIKPYTSITQIGTPNISLGLFQTYIDNGQIYTYQSYTGGSTINSCTPRSFDLVIGCSQINYLDSIAESSPCNFYGTLYTPSACGIDFNVGQELASASGTPTPSVSRSVTPSVTSSISLSSTPLFYVTLFPTSSNTPAISPSNTPLFMISAWPTPSPVNVSATSTPLYFLTPYPSYNPNNGSSIGFLTGQTGVTGMILGAVAVAMVGGGAILFTINHFRKGGTAGGFCAILIKNRKAIIDKAKSLPIPESAKSMIDKADGMITEHSKNVSGLVEKATNNELIPEEMRGTIKKLVPKSSDDLAKMVENPNEFAQGAKKDLTDGAKASFKKNIISKNTLIPDEYKDKLSQSLDKLIEKSIKSSTATPTPTPNTIIEETGEEESSVTEVHVDVDTTATKTLSIKDLRLSPDELEFIKKTLEEKKKTESIPSAVDI